MKTSIWYAIKNGQGYALVKEKPKGQPFLKAAIFLPIKKRSARAKGSRLEIEVAKRLNKWLYEGVPVLRRTPLSGGWSKGLGDIAVDPRNLQGREIPNLYIECKCWKSVTGENLIQFLMTGEPTFYKKWLNEAIANAGKSLCMLIVQGNLMEPYVIIPTLHELASKSISNEDFFRGAKLGLISLGAHPCHLYAFPFRKLLQKPVPGILWEKRG